MDLKGTKKSGMKFQMNREAEMKVKEFSQSKSTRKEFTLYFFSSFTCFFLWQLSLRIAGIQVFQEALSCIPEDLSQTDVSLWEFEIHSPFLNWP